MYCKYCGRALDSDARFCPQCGNSVAQQSTASSGGGPKNNRKTVFTVIIGIVLIVAVFATVLLLTQCGKAEEENSSYPTATLYYTVGNEGACIVGLDYDGYKSDLSVWTDENEKVYSYEITMTNSRLLVVPEELDGFVVISLEDDCFAYCTVLDGIQFESPYIKNVDPHVFEGCDTNFFVIAEKGSETYEELKYSGVYVGYDLYGGRMKSVHSSYTPDENDNSAIGAPDSNDDWWGDW